MTSATDLSFYGNRSPPIDTGWFFNFQQTRINASNPTMSRDPTERQWVWNLPEHFNIGSACSDRHLKSPIADQTAMIVEDDRLGTADLTFHGLARQSGQFAQALRMLGVEPGERVLVRLPNSLEYPVAFLGTMKRGAIAVPSSTLLVAEEVRFLVEDSAAVAMVIHKSMWPDLSRELVGIDSLRHVILSGEGGVPENTEGFECHDLGSVLSRTENWQQVHPTRADDPAYLVYTSGTTGRPKGVLHAHRALIGRTPASRYWFDFQPGDRILHSGKLNWTYALGTGLMDPLYEGKTVVVHEGDNDAATWPHLIAKHRCTIFIGVPAIFRQILQKTDYSQEDVPSLRHCMSAGEHLSDDVLRSWKERFGRDIYQALGMSECSYYISQDKHLPIQPGSSGLAQPGHDIQIMDSNLQPVADDQEGMICIPGDDPGLFLGYWRRDAETHDTMREGWFLTGDYARRDRNGYIWFMGRRDDIINSFGYRISPHEIERVMKAHPGVLDCVALGYEIASGKTLVTLCAVLRPRAKVTAEDLLTYGKQHLAAYKRPRLIYLAHEFPRTKNGKVMRRIIKQEVERNSALLRPELDRQT